MHKFTGVVHPGGTFDPQNTTSLGSRYKEPIKIWRPGRDSNPQYEIRNLEVYPLAYQGLLMNYTVAEAIKQF